MYYIEYWESENEPSYTSCPVVEDVVDFIRMKLQEDSSRCVSDFRVIRETDVPKEIQDFILGETNV